MKGIRCVMNMRIIHDKMSCTCAPSNTDEDRKPSERTYKSGKSLALRMGRGYTLE